MKAILVNLKATTTNLDKITQRVDKTIAAGKLDEVLVDSGKL